MKKRRVPRMHFQRRLFGAFVLITGAVFLVCALLFYFYNSRVVREDWERACLQSSLALENTLELLLNSLDSTTKEIHASETVMSLMQEVEQSESPQDYFALHPKTLSQMQSVIYMATTSGGLMGRIAVTSNHFDRVSLSNTLGEIPFSKEQIAQMPLIREGLESGEYRFFRGPYEDPWNRKHEQILTVLRPLRGAYRVYGLIEYSITLDKLASILAQSGFARERFWIADGAGQTVYASPEGGEIFPDAREADFGKPVYRSGFLTVTLPLEIAGWNLVFAKDVGEMRYTQNILYPTILLSMLAALVISVICAYFISSQLSRPIREMKKAVDKLSLSSEVRISLPSQNNEIAALVHALENMMSRLSEQNAALVNAREREMQAYMHTLEAQMDSHFLYNTLAVIGVCGLESGNENVARMCSELASLLRYSVEYTASPVTLGEEIRNIRSYLYIMKMRYGDNFEPEWNLDASLESVAVPKLILQPVVENCFKHGFVDADPIWRISIAGFRAAHGWRIRVENNGTPPGPEELERFFGRVARMREAMGRQSGRFVYEKGSFGLVNTVMRLHGFYNGAEHFRFGVENGLTFVEIGGNCDDTDAHRSGRG